MSVSGKLYLIPVPIADMPVSRMIPQYNLEVVVRLRHFIAEDARSARAFLKKFQYNDISQAEIMILNEHTSEAEIDELLKPLLSGNDVGLMSDAGCPGVADPGAEVVSLSHQKGIEVVPLVGPSSILLAVMSSGFTGQNFAFVGYLPVDRTERARRIRELEQLSVKHQQAQFFIETPYRNEQMLETLMSSLSRDTMLFAGADLQGDRQFIKAAPVSAWKQAAKPSFHKVPVVFGIYRNP